MAKGWTWLTAAGVVTHKPCRLLDMVITPSSTNAELTVYDGENDTAPTIFDFFTSVKVTWPYCFNGGLKLDRGLYIGSFTSITGVLVQWEVD